MAKHTGSDHAAALKQALDDLCDAMTFRWRDVVGKDILYYHKDNYPDHFKRRVSSFDTQMWPYWTAAASHHLGNNGANCAYAQWLDGGQKGKLSSVTCDGYTGSQKDDPYLDEHGDKIPEHIECGMGSILELVKDWARGECDVVYDRLPKFDTHDLDAIKTAHDDFLEIGSKLALKPKGDSGHLDVSFSTLKDRDISGSVGKLSGEDKEGQDWWAGWTGLAASRAKDGFFASVTPTINNQSVIAGALANLYSTRAAIIEAARNNGLYCIQWATTRLHKSQKVTTDLTPGWKTLEGIGGALAIAGEWSVAGAVVGASLSLVGFLGENLMPDITFIGEKHGLDGVVTELFTRVDKVNSDVHAQESDYEESVLDLQYALYDVNSFDLELYDLTENNAGGDRDGDKGYQADVEDILRIGEACYEAGDDYAALIPTIDDTSDVDKHISGADGSPTPGDTAVLEVRDQLRGFLKTTAGRYLLAGDEVKKSAKEYVSVETDQKAAYDRIMADWDKQDVGEGDPGIDPKKESKATDRGTLDPNEYPGHPSTPAEPGTDSGSDYVTDKNE